MATPTVLALGSIRRAEFRTARQDLERLADFHAVEDVEQALDYLSDPSQFADLIFLVQAYPGQWRAEDLDRLRNASPLSHFIHLLGSWCEGESRSGRPLPGCFRLYWHQWKPLAFNDFVRMCDGRVSGWSMNPTADAEDRVLLRTSSAPNEGEGLILIRGVSDDVVSLLVDTAESLGYSTEVSSGERLTCVGVVPAAVVLECDDDREASLGRVATAWRRWPDVPIVCVLGFPRVDDERAFLEAGATAVVSKPLPVYEMFDLLGRAKRI